MYLKHLSFSLYIKFVYKWYDGCKGLSKWFQHLTNIRLTKVERMLDEQCSNVFNTIQLILDTLSTGVQQC